MTMTRRTKTDTTKAMMTTVWKMVKMVLLIASTSFIMLATAQETNVGVATATTTSTTTVTTSSQLDDRRSLRNKRRETESADDGPASDLNKGNMSKSQAQGSPAIKTTTTTTTDADIASTASTSKNVDSTTLAQAQAKLSPTTKTTTATDANVASKEPSSWNLSSLSNNFSNSSINATALSLSACENIDRAISYLTSLNWNLTNVKAIAQHRQEQPSLNTSDAVETTREATTTSTVTVVWRSITLADQRAEYRDVYLLQGFVILPLSLAFLFMGSSLLWYVSIIAAAALGVFVVFHSLPQWISMWARGGRSHGLWLLLWLDCPMKLSLSVVSALISALLASTFLRFGIFCLGVVTAGSVTYLILDSFPQLMGTMNFDGSDYYFNANTTSPAVNGSFTEFTGADGVMSTSMSSDLSPFGWFLTGFMGLVGGWFLRWNEEATLELITSLLGGIGLSFSLHTTVLLRGGELDRSWVFLLATASALLGWHVQRRRRIAYKRYDLYRQLKQHDGDDMMTDNDSRRNDNRNMSMYSSLQQPPQPSPMMIHPLQWHTLQSLLPAPSAHAASSAAPAASAEQISELIAAIRSLKDHLGTSNSKDNGTSASPKEAKKDSRHSDCSDKEM